MGEKDLAVEIKVRRSAVGSRSASEIYSYKLRYHERMTLQNALEQIYRTEDASLAFRPFHCGKGTCMSCLVSINGKRKQACAAFLNPGETVLVEPDPNRALVRDLVTIPSGSKTANK